MTMIYTAPSAAPGSAAATSEPGAALVAPAAPSTDLTAAGALFAPLLVLDAEPPAGAIEPAAGDASDSAADSTPVDPANAMLALLLQPSTAPQPATPAGGNAAASSAADGSAAVTATRPAMPAGAAALPGWSADPASSARPAATAAPQAYGTAAPSAAPGAWSAATAAPSNAPVARGTAAPTGAPSGMPAVMPTATPNGMATAMPTGTPTGAPTAAPSSAPAAAIPVAWRAATAAPSSAPIAVATPAPTSVPPPAGAASAPDYASPSSDASTTGTTPQPAPTAAPSAAPVQAGVYAAQQAAASAAAQSARQQAADQLLQGQRRVPSANRAEPQSISGAALAAGAVPAATLTIQAAVRDADGNTGQPLPFSLPAAGQQSAVSADAPVQLRGSPEQWQQPLRAALGDRLQLSLQRNNDHAVIRLEPPNMGTVDISIRHSGGALQISLAASNSEVLRQLNTIGDSVRQDLSQRNFTDVAVTVSASPRGGNPSLADGGSGRQPGQEQQQRAPGRALSEAELEQSTFAIAAERE